MSSSSNYNLVQFLDIPVHLLEAQPEEIVAHLKDAHRRFQEADIPRIEQQFLGLMKLYPNAPTLAVIFNLFQKFRLEMQWHIEQEEKELYPMVLSGEFGTKGNAISHEDQEPLLTEVIQLLGKARYSKSPFGSVLISSLERLEEELRLHAWVEEHLLLIRD